MDRLIALVALRFKLDLRARPRLAGAGRGTGGGGPRSLVRVGGPGVPGLHRRALPGSAGPRAAPARAVGGRHHRGSDLGAVPAPGRRGVHGGARPHAPLALPGAAARARAVVARRQPPSAHRARTSAARAGARGFPRRASGPDPGLPASRRPGLVVPPGRGADRRASCSTPWPEIAGSTTAFSSSAWASGS